MGVAETILGSLGAADDRRFRESQAKKQSILTQGQLLGQAGANLSKGISAINEQKKETALSPERIDLINRVHSKKLLPSGEPNPAYKQGIEEDLKKARELESKRGSGFYKPAVTEVSKYDKFGLLVYDKNGQPVKIKKYGPSKAKQYRESLKSLNSRAGTLSELRSMYKTQIAGEQQALDTRKSLLDLKGKDLQMTALEKNIEMEAIKFGWTKEKYKEELSNRGFRDRTARAMVEKLENEVIEKLKIGERQAEAQKWERSKYEEYLENAGIRGERAQAELDRYYAQTTSIEKGVEAVDQQIIASKQNVLDGIENLRLKGKAIDNEYEAQQARIAQGKAGLKQNDEHFNDDLIYKYYVAEMRNTAEKNKIKEKSSDNGIEVEKLYDAKAEKLVKQIEEDRTKMINDGVSPSEAQTFMLSARKAVVRGIKPEYVGQLGNAFQTSLWDGFVNIGPMQAENAKTLMRNQAILDVGAIFDQTKGKTKQTRGAVTALKAIDKIVDTDEQLASGNIERRVAEIITYNMFAQKGFNDINKWKNPQNYQAAFGQTATAIQRKMKDNKSYSASDRNVIHRSIIEGMQEGVSGALGQKAILPAGFDWGVVGIKNVKPSAIKTIFKNYKNYLPIASDHTGVNIELRDMFLTEDGAVQHKIKTPEYQATMMLANYYGYINKNDPRYYKDGQWTDFAVESLLTNNDFFKRLDTTFDAGQSFKK